MQQKVSQRFIVVSTVIITYQKSTKVQSLEMSNFQDGRQTLKCPLLLHHYHRQVIFGV